MARRWIIFRCDKDNCWIVARLDEGSDVAFGVADCPDEQTAQAVAEALRMRDARRVE